MIEEDGALIGCVGLYRVNRNTCELRKMYLRRDCRGRGIGRRLLTSALEWARATGVHTIKLDTTEEMRAARRLYEAHGFVRVAGTAPRQGQQRLLYELHL